MSPLRQPYELPTSGARLICSELLWALAPLPILKSHYQHNVHSCDCYGCRCCSSHYSFIEPRNNPGGSKYPYIRFLGPKVLIFIDSTLRPKCIIQEYLDPLGMLCDRAPKFSPDLRRASREPAAEVLRRGDRPRALLRHDPGSGTSEAANGMSYSQ